jgi:uncharacterized membrane protein HdeD (DUF308 family)
MLRENVHSHRQPPPEEAAMNKTLGIILIVLGLFGLAWGGFTYTTREKVVDIGPIHATRDKTHSIPLPPIVGAVALIGGVVLLIAGKRE